MGRRPFPAGGQGQVHLRALTATLCPVHRAPVLAPSSLPWALLHPRAALSFLHLSLLGPCSSSPQALRIGSLLFSAYYYSSQVLIP